MSEAFSKSVPWLLMALAVGGLPTKRLLGQTPTVGSTNASNGAAGEGEQTEPAPTDIPAVTVIRESNPTTPAELLRAVVLLLDLDRPDLAQQYFTQLVGLDLTDQQLVQLHAGIGTARLMRLAQSRQLVDDQAREFVFSVFRSVRQANLDPTRLAEYVDQLHSDEDAVRNRAATMLFRAGEAAVDELVKSIAAAGDRQQIGSRAASRLIQRLEDEAIEPLIALLMSDQPELRAVAIEQLGMLRRKATLPYLVRPLLSTVVEQRERAAAAEAWRSIAGGLPSRQEALELLEETAASAYASGLGQAADRLLETTWSWDFQERTAESHQLTLSMVKTLQAARLYRDLAELTGGGLDSQALSRHLISQLQLDQSLLGLDEQLPQQNQSLQWLQEHSDGDASLRLIREALDSKKEAAALALVRWLEGQATPSMLRSKARLWVRLLTHPNRRLRFATAITLIEFDPTASMVGGSHLMDELAYFARATGDPQAVVAATSLAEGRNLAGLLSRLGIQARAVTSAAELARVAATESDLQLILISRFLPDKTVWQTVETLRNHPHTRRVPIGIVLDPEQFESPSQFAPRDARTKLFVQPDDIETLGMSIAPLLQTAENDFPDGGRRLAKAEASLAALETVSRSRTDAADLVSATDSVIAALHSPASSGPAIAVLRQMGSPLAQQALADFASATVRPDTLRKAAAEAFESSLERFGLLLSSPRIRTQLRLPPDSEAADNSRRLVRQAIVDQLSQEAESRGRVFRLPDNQQPTD